MLFDCAKMYGKVFAISLGGKPSLIVADPEMVRQIMIKYFPKFHNRLPFEKLKPPLDKTSWTQRTILGRGSETR